MSYFKRETSVSVDDLHHLSENIKRVAISVDGKAYSRNTADSEFDQSKASPQRQLNLKMPSSESTNSLINPIMSTSKENFSESYKIVDEIGRGGFSTVFRCISRLTDKVFAVKVVDLRPLRLRERFNPNRIRREVDIMRRLSHPNIIQFVDVFENTDQLMMVMEFFPGEELFDVILNRKFFSEKDAKPIFTQICSALFYLHSLNVIHRDIKPENVLISRHIDPNTGYPIAKLVDFGLSKNAGAGSAAKTFVGTPCYLAPEVEYTSKGLGGTYGLPADCWSLGAVLYVMLVARFPEFEQDPVANKIVLRLSPALWDNVSSAAKELIRALMNTNPAARLTVAGAWQHPWLGSYRASNEEMRRIALACYELGQGLQEEEAGFNQMDDEDNDVTKSAMVVHMNNTTGAGGGHAGGNHSGEQFPVTPLLHLQRKIADCFTEAHACFIDMPEVAGQIRQAASLCRQQLMQSLKMLRQVEQTATAVLNIFPDLVLAVEEGEPKLAMDFFNIVRTWVIELKDLVFNTQKVHKESVEQIQILVEQSTVGLQKRENLPMMNQALIKLAEMVYHNRVVNGSQNHLKKITDATATTTGSAAATTNTHEHINNNNNNNNKGSGSGTDSEAMNLSVVGGASAGVLTDPATPSPSLSLTQEDVLELFMNLFSQHPNTAVLKQIASGSSSPTQPHSDSTKLTTTTATATNTADRKVVEMSSDSAAAGNGSVPSKSAHTAAEEANGHGHVHGYGMDLDSPHQTQTHAATPATGNRQVMSVPASAAAATSATSGYQLEVSSNTNLNTQYHRNNAARQTQAAARLHEALENLNQIDLILVQLSIFWNNTEVVLDVLTKKGQHAEQMIGFANKPKLMARFLERLEEYKRFWESVSIMCSNYVSGVDPNAQHDQDMDVNFSTHTSGSSGTSGGSSAQFSANNLSASVTSSVNGTPGSVQRNSSSKAAMSTSTHTHTTTPSAAAGGGAGAPYFIGGEDSPESSTRQGGYNTINMAIPTSLPMPFDGGSTAGSGSGIRSGGRSRSGSANFTAQLKGNKVRGLNDTGSMYGFLDQKDLLGGGGGGSNNSSGNLTAPGSAERVNSSGRTPYFVNGSVSSPPLTQAQSPGRYPTDSSSFIGISAQSLKSHDSMLSDTSIHSLNGVFNHEAVAASGASAVGSGSSSFTATSVGRSGSSNHLATLRSSGDFELMNGLLNNTSAAAMRQHCTTPQPPQFQYYQQQQQQQQQQPPPPPATYQQHYIPIHAPQPQYNPGVSTGVHSGSASQAWNPSKLSVSSTPDHFAFGQLSVSSSQSTSGSPSAALSGRISPAAAAMLAAAGAHTAVTAGSNSNKPPSPLYSANGGLPKFFQTLSPYQQQQQELNVPVPVQPQMSTDPSRLNFSPLNNNEYSSHSAADRSGSGTPGASHSYHI